MPGVRVASLRALRQVERKRVTAVKRKLAWWLRCAADRIDRAHAPKATHWHFTFERGVGAVFNEDSRGCRLWYLGDEDYERAHAEAANPP